MVRSGWRKKRGIAKGKTRGSDHGRSSRNSLLFCMRVWLAFFSRTLVRSQTRICFAESPSRLFCPILPFLSFSFLETNDGFAHVSRLGVYPLFFFRALLEHPSSRSYFSPAKPMPRAATFVTRACRASRKGKRSERARELKEREKELDSSLYYLEPH